MEIEIRYSKRKTLSVTVREGQVIVRSPIELSRQRINAFIEKHRDWIDERLKRNAERIDHVAEMSRTEIEALRERARKLLTAKTEHYSKMMGLKYGRITITGAKTRFGSCSSRGNISYSYRLLFYPDEAIDYVVVHELAHLLEMNHSAKFYKIVEKILPDYKQRIKLLK